MIKVGEMAKDSITGFTGIVVARTEWLNGCARITLQPKGLKDGKPVLMETFDEMQIEVVKGKGWKEPRVTNTGGPRPSPVQATTPSRQ